MYWGTEAEQRTERIAWSISVVDSSIFSSYTFLGYRKKMDFWDTIEINQPNYNQSKVKLNCNQSL